MSLGFKRLIAEIIRCRWGTNKWPRIIEEIMMTGEERRTLTKTHLSANLCIRNHTWTRLGWNQDHRFGSLATTRLRHSKASITLNMSRAYRRRNCSAWRAYGNIGQKMQYQIKMSFVGHSARTRTLSVAYVLGFLLRDGLQLECQLFKRVQKNHLLVLPLLRKLIDLRMHNIVSIAAFQGFTCQANFTEIS